MSTRVARLEPAKGRAGPAPPGHELERTRGDLDARGRDADDARLALALVAALKRCAHCLGQADALERVVEAAKAVADRYVHVCQDLLDGRRVVARVDAIGCNKGLSHFDLLGDDVDGKDAAGARGLAAHDDGEPDGEPDGAHAKDGHGPVLLELHRVERGAVARCDAAPEQADLVERRRLVDLGD